MEPIFLVVMLVIGIATGILGALFGIGGGLFIVPALTLIVGLGPKEAAAISLVSIIATSIGGTVFYLDHGVTNIRLGLLLEISTVIGAITGAVLAGYLEDWLIMTIFIIVVLISATRMLLNRNKKVENDPEGEFSFCDNKTGKEMRYSLKNKPLGFVTCSLAGVISSLSGVGGGLIKVPVMNMMMNVPMKAATATSSYMIGITAFSGAIIYFLNGQVDLEVAAFTTIGTFIGAMIGSRFSKKFDGSAMKKYFSFLLFIIAGIMCLKVGGVL
ncbi:MAG: sulfite exporter TauE/SafE family protein [Candidatus Methanomethylophilaceae archaeon]|nr:sulfite exporter TauE/SafE family protein [Candidatus Methanomethylophilaceae archaeon]